MVLSFCLDLLVLYISLPFLVLIFCLFYPNPARKGISGTSHPQTRASPPCSSITVVLSLSSRPFMPLNRSATWSYIYISLLVRPPVCRSGDPVRRARPCSLPGASRSSSFLCPSFPHLLSAPAGSSLTLAAPIASPQTHGFSVLTEQQTTTLTLAWHMVNVRTGESARVRIMRTTSQSLQDFTFYYFFDAKSRNPPSWRVWKKSSRFLRWYRRLLPKKCRVTFSSWESSPYQQLHTFLIRLREASIVQLLAWAVTIETITSYLPRLTPCVKLC